QLASHQLAKVLHDALLFEGQEGPTLTTMQLSIAMMGDRPEEIPDPIHSFLVAIGNNPFQ
ncbi:MAG TPA: hypothetical protein VK775_07455, partial [Chthoniobacterales bacterium]|nr:hypothetical protein [Chthoniobacterales bacterium]